MTSKPFLAARACALTIKRSKSASKTAVSVSQPTNSQNKMNHTGCARSVACKNVAPKNKSNIATSKMPNMAHRRVV